MKEEGLRYIVLKKLKLEGFESMKCFCLSVTYIDESVRPTIANDS